MQLIYRGSNFTFQPATTSLPKAVLKAPQTLIYQGFIYTYRKPVNETQAFPKAVNWRFAQACQVANSLSPAHI